VLTESKVKFERSYHRDTNAQKKNNLERRLTITHIQKSDIYHIKYVQGMYNQKGHIYMPYSKSKFAVETKRLKHSQREVVFIP